MFCFVDGNVTDNQKNMQDLNDVNGSTVFEKEAFRQI